MRYFASRLAIAVVIAAVLGLLRQAGAIAQDPLRSPTSIVEPSPTPEPSPSPATVRVVSVDPSALGDLFTVLAGMSALTVMLLAAILIAQFRR